MKFEADDLERWQRWATEHGLNRTELVEQAVESFIAGVPPGQALVHTTRTATTRTFRARTGVTSSADAKRGVLPIESPQRGSK